MYIPHIYIYIHAIYEPIYSHKPQNYDEDWYGAVYIIHKKHAYTYILNTLLKKAL